MGDWARSHAFTIGIVGGGRGGCGLLQFFGHSGMEQVVFLVDADANAPGILAAREAGVPTFTDAAEALRMRCPEFLFNATEDEALTGQMQVLVRGSDTQIVAPGTSRMIVRVMEENTYRIREDVSCVVGTIQKELTDSLEGSRNLVGQINSIISSMQMLALDASMQMLALDASMQMLALDASIEPAKAGVHGRGFTVVADHIGKSVETVRKLTQEVDGVNANIIQLSDQTDSVLEKLR